VRKYYLISNYRNRDIDTAYLQNQLISDLNTSRQAGTKLIPRFTYTWNLNQGDSDASASRIVGHLEQLRPIFGTHYDVISHLEIGFVGYWGEWHSSKQGNVNNGDLTLNANSRAIIAKALEVLPKNRMVLLRYVKQLMQLHPTPLGAGQAYNGSDRARLGLHDDGALYDETHFGSYDSDATVRQQQRSYQAQATRFVAMSGEPGGINSTRYALKVDPLTEFARMHWSSLSMGQGDSDELYAHWKKQGVYDEIGRQLGYRFSLVEAEVPAQAAPGGPFTLSFNVKNSGFASPYNPRYVEIVLRNRQSKREFFLRVQSDPRRWQPGTTTRVALNATLPASMPAGTYDAFLNLPDPAPKLYGRPAYSVRLANDGVWEAYSGYNALKASVRVGAQSAARPSTGPTFQEREDPPTPPAPEPTITLTPEPVSPTPAPSPTLEEGDVLVDFEGAPRRLRGDALGLTWSGPWRTANDARGSYAYLRGRGRAEGSVTLPTNTVLKGVSLHKLAQSGSVSEITLRSEGNPDYTWTDPAPWWSEHLLNWKVPAAEVHVMVVSDSEQGAANLLLDNFVYGTPPPEDTVVDFENLAPGTALSGPYGGVTWGEGWKVDVAEDGNTFVYLDSTALEATLTFTLPEGTVLKSLGMSKRTGEDADGDAIRFIDQAGSQAGWSWIPVGYWQNGYGTEWTQPSGTVTVRVSASGTNDYNVSNVMIGFLSYGAP